MTCTIMLAQIDEHPVAVLLTLDAVRPESRRLGLFDHALRDRAHVPIGGATRDHHEVRNVGEATHVQHLDFQGFHIGQGVDHHGPERRLRLGIFAIVGGLGVAGSLRFSGGHGFAGSLRFPGRLGFAGGLGFASGLGFTGYLGFAGQLGFTDRPWLAGHLGHTACGWVLDRCLAVLIFAVRGLFFDWHYVVRGLE